MHRGFVKPLGDQRQVARACCNSLRTSALRPERRKRQNRQARRQAYEMIEYENQELP